MVKNTVSTQFHTQVSKRGIAGNSERIRERHFISRGARTPTIVADGRCSLRQLQTRRGIDFSFALIVPRLHSGSSGDEFDSRTGRVKTATNGPVFHGAIRVVT